MAPAAALHRRSRSAKVRQAQHLHAAAQEEQEEEQEEEQKKESHGKEGAEHGQWEAAVISCSRWQARSALNPLLL